MNFLTTVGVIIVVIVGILSVLFAMDKLSGPYRRKCRKKMLASMETLKEALGGDLHDIDNFLTLKSSYDGMHYECHYFIGGSHVVDNWRINSLGICVRNCQCSELFIRKDDRLSIGKKVGLIDKCPTNDKRFDNRFFIETVDRQYAEELLKKQEVRQAIMRAADNDVRDFNFINNKLIINMNVDEYKERADLEDVQAVLHNLKIIYDNLPTVPVDSQLIAEGKNFKEKNNTGGRLILLFIVATIIAAINNDIFYKDSLEQEDL